MTKKTKFIILIALSATAIILSMVLCALKETNFSSATAMFSCIISILGIYLIFKKVKSH